MGNILRFGVKDSNSILDEDNSENELFSILIGHIIYYPTFVTWFKCLFCWSKYHIAEAGIPYTHSRLREQNILRIYRSSPYKPKKHFSNFVG